VIVIEGTEPHLRNGDKTLVNEMIAFGPFQLFASGRRLLRDEMPLDIGSRSLDILIALVERAGEVVGKKELVARVWPDVVVEESSLRTHVAGLRKALGDGREGARYVANVPGRGYCFVAPITRAAPPKPGPVADPLPAELRSRLPTRLARMIGRDHALPRGYEERTEQVGLELSPRFGIGAIELAGRTTHRKLWKFEERIEYAVSQNRHPQGRIG
jgi:DNA-binding winged helix-turn-helix (wHTH) protein